MFFGHCDRNPARQQNRFRHCFLLDFRDPPVVVRECGPDGEVPMDSFEMLQNVTFVPLPAPRYYNALSTDRDPEPLATFVERLPVKAAQRNQRDEEGAARPTGVPPPPPPPREFRHWREEVRERTLRAGDAGRPGRKRPRRSATNAPSPPRSPKEDDPDGDVNPEEDQFEGAAGAWQNLANADPVMWEPEKGVNFKAG